MKNIFLFSVLLLLFTACEEELTIPKPPLYLRSNFPKHEYVPMNQPVPYSYEVNKNFLVKPVLFQNQLTNHQEIQLGELNGILYLNYYTIPNRDTLARYINLSNDKVDEHQVKAKSIEDTQIIDAKNRVFGTFFEFKGDVATNFQFYLTDSTKHFIRGEMLFNVAPNYDSLRPSIDYMKQDLEHLIKTFRWKN